MTQYLAQMRSLVPGLVLCFTIAAAANFLSEHYGAPVMLFALLLGMAFHFLAEDGKCLAGIEFTAKRLLRIGVALLGARVTAGQITSLGIGPVIAIPALVLITILFGILFSRLLGKSVRLGLLTGGAVAICGASAALAIVAVLPAEDGEKDTLFTVIAVTTLSTIAMIAYPIFYATLGLDDAGIGFLLGATIHDVAQVVGAGYAVSDGAGDVATYVKMLRVSLLPIVVLAIAFMYRKHKSGEKKAAIPGFAIAFGVILLANSLGLIPPVLAGAMTEASRWLLVAAIAALGVKTSLKAMTDLGPRYLGLVLGQTVFLAFAAIGALYLIA
ncbi:MULTISPECIES: putative sulfate exporter family transporter [unclassified Iodidimonas]|uniref:YeiH family protein n=1 Tax=unclassified Iodidimonas TaxID=2626145 RepID=UPI002482A6F9|nr:MULTISPECIES: putative sulfate exporter family transporter [unclassified Iodidimonas]